jgi:hypothetical protein
MNINSIDTNGMSWLQNAKVSSTLTVSESVMKKLTGLESVTDIDAVAELELPLGTDFSSTGEE